jgi:hypothetical protein
MKKHLHEFHDIRRAALDLGGRDDIPRPVPRARGGRTAMRSAGGADVDRDQPRRSKRRATSGRSGKSKAMAMSGEAVRYRGDRAPRRKQKLADGGVPGGASAMPYGGAPGYVPVVQLQPAHFSAPAVPNQPDYTQQMMNAIGTWGKGDSKDGGQGLIGGIKLPGGGTLGDATSDALQDFRMDTLGLSAARGGMVRKCGGNVRAVRPQDFSPKRGRRVSLSQKKGQS